MGSNSITAVFVECLGLKRTGEGQADCAVGEKMKVQLIPELWTKKVIMILVDSS